METGAQPLLFKRVYRGGLIFYWIHRVINLIIEEVYRGFNILMDTQGHKPYY